MAKINATDRPAPKGNMSTDDAQKEGKDLDHQNEKDALEYKKHKTENQIIMRWLQ